MIFTKKMDISYVWRTLFVCGSLVGVEWTHCNYKDVTHSGKLNIWTEDIIKRSTKYYNTNCYTYMYCRRRQCNKYRGPGLGSHETINICPP